MKLLPLSLLTAAIVGSVAVLPGQAAASGPRECDVDPTIQCPSNPTPIDERPINQSEGGQAVGGSAGAAPASASNRAGAKTSRVTKASTASVPEAKAAPAEAVAEAAPAVAEASSPETVGRSEVAYAAPSKVTVAGTSRSTNSTAPYIALGTLLALIGGVSLMLLSEQSRRDSHS